MAKTWNEETEKNVQGVVNEKSKWQAAYDAGDEEGMKAASEAAKTYYKSLTDSGNYDVAKDLQQSDYDMAVGYLENYKGTKSEKTNRGMATENIRTATDTAANQSDFADRSADAIFEGYENQEERINANPMETDAAKAIMARYRGLGEDARGDALADGSVRNDGNLDSFTKANADRQRQAYEEAGVESVFDLHDRNVVAGGQNYRDLQSGIGVANGVYNDTITNANNTATNATDIENTNRQSDVGVQAQEAEITGYVPEELANKNNPYFNEDGTLKEVYLSEEFDNQGGFATMIADAEARGDKEEVRMLEEARLWKVQNVPGYEEYVSTATAPNAQQTEAGRQFDESVRLSEEGNKLVKHEVDTKADLEREKTAADLFAEAAKYEAMGMPEVAESLRKYADVKNGSATAEEKTEDAGTLVPQTELTENTAEEPADLSTSGLSKTEIIRQIIKTEPDRNKRQPKFDAAGITADDLAEFYETYGG